jgi:two-component system, OmpR family, response regulator RegX3
MAGAAAGVEAATTTTDGCHHHHVRRKLLLVEDERSIVEPLAEALEGEGFETHVATTASEALDLFGRVDPDLVLLDLMLPDGSGFEVCGRMRASSPVPIIMLTAKGEEADRVAGLELGADDYVVKPFSAREVTARIRAVLRRAERHGGGDGALRLGGVELDADAHTVTVGGDAVELTRREFDLLEMLMRNAGVVVTRERLLEEVWDTNWFGSTKTLDVHVSAVRRKIGDDPSAPRYIHTVRGVGFRFAAARDLEGS